ncbi:MAG TPA: tetratricopeptide repeat protein [Sedimentisphaerales bacterium]|nr:tetratricopeptide repeat protein [Sedimentisphaerales bacterium]
MKTETKNVEPNSGIGHRASDIGRRASLYTLLSICFLTSLVDAQISSEQLDPTNSLVPYLTQTLFDVNIPPVHLMQPVKSHSTTQQQSQISNVDAVSSATEANQKMPRRGFTVPEKQGNSLGRQLWRAGISAYEGEKEAKSKSKLRRIIEQIRSIEFARPKKTVEPVIIVEPVVKTVEPNETSSNAEAKEETVKKAIEPKLPYGLLTGRTLQLVGNLAQHPDRSDNPFALGEVLYYSGRLKEAAVFYQEALKRKSSDKAGSDQDRAWILFQMGNCLRGDDPPTAKKMYGLLIAEYSDSPWVDLAKAREGLIDWQQKDKPRTLIAAESQL